MTTALQRNEITLSLETPTLDNVCLDQTTAGAANLTINGPLAAVGAVALASAHKLDLESVANLSAINFTITGTDANDIAQIEIIAGPNANTVTTSYYFKTVTQIAVDGAVGTAVSVGTSDEAATKDIASNYKASSGFGLGVAVTLTGTINYTVQHTYNDVDVKTTDDSVYFDHASLASNTANAEGGYTTPNFFVRLIVNSYTAGATIVFYSIKD